ncbi:MULTISPECIES: hypothetical protein [unclassified Microcoleus]|uniref:hypothetical protein n=1 Tax=unclassified Microcoleus TaxID=2642155 RepID=UPI0025EE31BE|nr:MULTISPECIES: hypothetical protein [unclassified Microcoleus]
MKRVLSLLSGMAIGCVSLAAFMPPNYVLRVETVKQGMLRLTNTSTQRIYVKNFVLRDYKINELGKRNGEVKEIRVRVEVQLNPGESTLEPTLDFYRTTANTELLRWNDGKKIHRDGLLICFINDFNHNVFVTPNGHLPCPK